MKRLLLSLCLSLSSLLAADPPAAPLGDSEGETVITSDSGAQFFLETKVAIYHGNVRVENPKLRLTCEHLTITSAAEGRGVETIVAVTNVVITTIETNGTTTTWSEKALYSAATGLLVISGGEPRLQAEPSHLQLWSPVITINLTNKTLVAIPPVRTKIPPGALGKLGQEGINLKPAATPRPESKK